MDVTNVLPLLLILPFVISIPCKQNQNTKLDCRHRNLNYIPSIAERITSVDLSNNQISSLEDEPFYYTSELLTLDMSFNKLSADIPSYCFQHLTSLSFLDLHNNELNHLSPYSFQGLQSLQYLDLSNNKLTLLPEKVFTNLNNLKSLNLSNNVLESLPTENLHVFKSLSVETLHLTFDKLSPFILREGMNDFHRLRDLSYLSLATGAIPKDIAEVVDMLDYVINLQINIIEISWGNIIIATLQEYNNCMPENSTSKLDCCQADKKIELLNSTINLSFNGWKKFTILGTLSTNSLKPLSKFEQLTSLALQDAEILDIEEDGAPFKWFPFMTQLDLSRNSLDYLPDSAFIGLDLLQDLSLAHNNLDIAFVDGALYNLPCLIKINMSSNYFLFIPSSAFSSLPQSDSLKVLDLSNNDLPFDFPDDAFSAIPSLKTLYLHSNEAIQIKSWINSLGNLTELYLQNNNYIEMFTAEWKITLHALSVLDLSECQHIRWYDGPANLCIIFPNLQTGFFHGTKIDLLMIRDLKHLRELDLSACQIFTGDLKTNWFHSQMDKLEILNLSNNNITSIPAELFANTPKLTNLNLSFNQLVMLQNATFLSFQYLQILDLQGNHLNDIHSIQIIPSLHVLNLAWNQFSAIQPNMISSHNLDSINLAGNPFECTCIIQDLLTWIATDTTVLIDDTDAFICSQPNKTKDQSIFNLHLNCVSYLHIYLSAGSSICVVIILIAGLLTRYRWYLKYKCFLILHRKPPIVLNDLVANNLPLDANHVTYNAYVSYSDTDEDWVLNDLRLNLEEHTKSPAKLCLGRVRDFLPGTPIVDAISDAVENSRKTILVLSPSFVESEWCYFESQMAQMRLFHEGCDVLILALLKDIPDNMMTMSLRKLLCKKDYFKWPDDRPGQRAFWQRLRYELQTPIKVNRRYDV